MHGFVIKTVAFIMNELIMPWTSCRPSKSDKIVSPKFKSSPTFSFHPFFPICSFFELLISGFVGVVEYRLDHI